MSVFDPVMSQMRDPHCGTNFSPDVSLFITTATALKICIWSRLFKNVNTPVLTMYCPIPGYSSRDDGGGAVV